MELFLDFETRSAEPIRNGTYKYALSSRPLLATWAVDGSDVRHWDATFEPFPDDLRHALNDGMPIVAHNAAFDRTVANAWGWGRTFNLDPSRWICTATMARICRLPGDLDRLCRALGLGYEQSKKEGGALIRLFCVPSPRRNGGFVEPWEEPEQWSKFIEYAKADIVAMRECKRRMPPVWTSWVASHYALTERMNDRGIYIDRELAQAAEVEARRIKTRLQDEATQLLDDEGEEIELNLASQQQILRFARDCGVEEKDLPNARADTLRRFVDSSEADKLPYVLVEVLRKRLRSNKASVAKYTALGRSTCPDGFLRGMIVALAAGTGRDAGRLFQAQNLSRPMFVSDEKPLRFDSLTEAIHPSLDGVMLSMSDAAAIIKAGVTQRLFLEDPMQLLSDAVRGVLIPRKGHKFAVADLSSIEGRTLPWLAFDSSKLQFFRDRDAGLLKYDSYKLAYAQCFGIQDPATVSKEQRQTGKPIDLALGYGGGVGAFTSMAAVYGVDLSKMARLVAEVAQPEVWAECAQKYDWAVANKFDAGLPVFEWTACQYIVTVWRRANQATASFWGSCQDAFHSAIDNKGHWFPAGRVHLYCDPASSWMYALLPSGRMLVYPNAGYSPGKKGRVEYFYWGINPATHQFSRVKVYGGKLAENFTQAAAGDVLFNAVPRLEAAGYPLVLRVHDEAVTEPIDSPEFTGEHVARIMCEPHAWCTDLPLAAAGETIYRYSK